VILATRHRILQPQVLDKVEQAFYNVWMPIDVTQLKQQIQGMAIRFAEARESRAQRVARLRRVFEPGFDMATLESALATISSQTSVRWTGAHLTAGERINQFYEAGIEPMSFALIATDGSQIMPDRHKAVQYAAIQAASACIVYGKAIESEQLAQAHAASKQKKMSFMDEQQLFDEDGEPVSAGEINTERDLQEIELMADLCECFRKAGVQPVAVADASIIPFALLNEPFVKNNTRRAAQLLERITRALERMRASQSIIAGYIDRPNSNALARTCSLADVPSTALSHEQRLRDALRRVAQDVRGITDRLLLEPILPAGHRTAMFEPAWLVNGPAYLGHAGHTMKACYLNVGTGRPAVVRIEMPEWCADAASVDILTGVMQRHANMGAGYPLILKAAHEEAVLTANDEAGIDLMIERGMIDLGILAMPSQKQEAKDKR
jgi:hypothetical protein